MIEVVSYDVWRTLLRPNSAYGTKRAQLIADTLGWDGDPALAKKAVSTASKELDKLMDETGQQFGFAPRVERAAELLGLPAPNHTDLALLEKTADAAHLRLPPSLMEESLPEVLRRHKEAGRRVAVISNTGMTSGKSLQDLLSVTGLLRYIDYELYSSEVGAAKPSATIFAALKKQSRTRSFEILHVGDNDVADVQGARAAGLCALRYAPDEQTVGSTIASHMDVLTHPVLV